MFLSEHELPVELENICLLSGEHFTDAYAAINPNCMVPLLEDGDFRLAECSAILKYLAEISGSPTYPQELRARARVNAAMDWFNTGLSFYLNYLHTYPQFLPHHAWNSPATQTEVLARGLEGARRALNVLDRHMLVDDYVCGEDVTIADYLGAAYLGVSDAIDFDLSAWPRVAAWMAGMRARPSWDVTHAAFDGMLTSLRDRRLAG
jgi:glutathione S-transferase